MSRCFPFPPPGYEKKARADEENLLNKEKQREKKHKDKKDREKREGKEKKEKDRSEEKRKEKKERKDKHKDKKDKHKHKDKERKSILAEKNYARPPEHDIAEKLSSSSVQSAQSSDTKFLLELGRRINNYDEISAEKNLLVHNFSLTGQGNYEMSGRDKGEDQRKVNGRQNGAVAENGFTQKFEGVHRGALERKVGLVEKSLVAENGFSQKFEGVRRGALERVCGLVGNSLVAENGFIQKSEGVHMGTLERVCGLVEKSPVAENGFIQKFEGVHQGTLEGVDGFVEKSVEKRMEQGENNKQYNGESRGGEQKERDHGKKIRVGLLVEKTIEKRTEQEESNKQKNGESRAGKHKDKDPERKSKSKDKKRDKEKEKEARKKEKELKKEQLKQKESDKITADRDNMKTAPHLQKDKSERFGGEGNVAKRKEIETNGFLHDTGTRPSKLARPTTSSHQIVDNGRMNEPYKTAIRFVEDLEGNKKISISPSVSGNGRILETSPGTISSTHQLMVNGRKSEPSKTAIRIVTEFGEGNKKVTSSLSITANGKVTEPQRSKPAISTKEPVKNGTEQAAVCAVSEEEGNNKKVLFSISVAGTGSEMEPPTPSLPAPENGRKIELSRSSDQSSSGGNMVIFNHKVVSKETRVNDKDEFQQPNVSLKRPSSSLKQVKEKVKPKPPHPDTKFLDRIFSIPKVEWSDFVDQEWLFGSELQQAKRPKLGASQVEGTTKEVWAEALHLDSADITALPYVIPY